MLNTGEILSTVSMIREQKLDIRTITMGISLYDLICDDPNRMAERVYDRICQRAGKLVGVGQQIEAELGIPIVNKRVSVTPISMVSASCGDPLPIIRAMDKAAKEIGVNFIGGYSALVQKGMTAADRRRKRIQHYAHVRQTIEHHEQLNQQRRAADHPYVKARDLFKHADIGKLNQRSNYRDDHAQRKRNYGKRYGHH